MKNFDQDLASESKWKRKYFDHLDKADAIEKRLRQHANTMAEGLIAACDFCGNLNHKAYKTCKPARQMLQKDALDSKLSQQIHALKNSYSNLEKEILDNRNHFLSALQSSIEQLLELALSAQNRRRLIKLKKNLPANDIDENGLIDRTIQFNKLLWDILGEIKPEEPKKDSPSLLDKVFKRDKPAPETTQESDTKDERTEPETPDPFTLAEPVKTSSTIAATQQHSDLYNPEQIASALLHLLNHLDIPKALSADNQRIKQSLQDNPQWLDLEQLLMPAIELTLSTIEWHYNQFSEFLEQINAQLDAVQNFLLATQVSRKDQKKNHNELNQSMSQVVNDIEHTIDHSEDLEQLKHTISQKVQGIVSSLAAYEEAEQQREDSLINELDTLSNKLQEMESQSLEMRSKLESQKQLARRDSVTQLPNRAAYDERIEFEYARWQRYQHHFSLLLADIDHFKKINDKYGHLAGDKVLKLVAKTMKSALRETDFIARYGGEEFAVILPNTSNDEALKTAEKLRKAVASCPFHRSGEQVEVTISIGISDPSDDDNIEKIFERTDQALYKAKESGRNRCCAISSQ